MLLNARMPDPVTHLLSNHYNETRTEYYRRLNEASRVSNGVMNFLVYALQGFVDGLTEQVNTIKDQIRKDVWTNYVHRQFQGRTGAADTRRRHLVLDLPDNGQPVRRREVRHLSPRLAEAYAGKTDKTITRDLNTLDKMGLITKTRGSISANKEIILAFSG